MVKRFLLFIFSFTFLFLASFSKTASALSSSDLRFYSQNNILFVNDAEDDFLNSCLSGELVDLGENSKTALNYLINKGYSATSAAAIVGNLIAESSVVPNKIEGGKIISDPSWRLTSWERFGKNGFGLAQWTSSGRQTKLQNFADQNGLPVISMEAQLGYLFEELSTGARGSSSKIENLNSMSLEDATFFIYRYFETPLSSYCTSNDKAGCYNNFAPKSFSDLSESETKSAYSAFMNRLKYARSALADVGSTDALTASSGGTSSLTCNGISENLEGAKKLVETAISMSWPNDRGYCESLLGEVPWKTRATGGTSACSNTLNAVAKLAQKRVGGISLRDCGKFVGAAVIYSEVDPDFPRVGVSSQKRYLESSNKWTKVSTDGEPYSLTNLEPGDIILYSSGSGNPVGGHIQIWIGEQTIKGKACPNETCKVNIASASYESWTPSLNHISRTSTTYNGVTYYHSVYRLAKTPETNIPASSEVSL